ncbi:MAG: immunoglobulin domain-containing protein [Phycisphaerales bacterium]|nr:immunoglobulin domain-containing protein [Phycisphaerales bacterium]
MQIKRMQTVRIVGALAALFLYACHFAVAQGCPERWIGGVGAPGMRNGIVVAVAEYDGGLIAGGSFSTAGGNPATNIAKWDGSAWEGLAGRGPNGFVYSLLPMDGALVVAGSFSKIGTLTANCVATWDGTQWRDMGSAGAAPFGSGSTIYKLLRYNGQLVAGGYFFQGNTPIGGAAYWTGSAWQLLGTGSSRFYDMLEFEGSLVACGSSGVFRLEGSAWKRLGLAFNGDVRTLGVHNGVLYAGGNFQSVGGTNAIGMARWNTESWSPVGAGAASVKSLLSFGGVLFASVQDGTFDGAVKGTVICWDGAKWFAPPFSLLGAPRKLEAFGNNLILAGDFFSEAVSTKTLNGIAKWNGESISQFGEGCGAPLNVVAARNGIVYGGEYTSNNPVAHITRWDGLKWELLLPVHGGLSVVPQVRTITFNDSSLFFGGRFLKAGSTPVDSVAEWDGVNVRPYLPGFNDPVHTMIWWNSRLVVGGGFGYSGGRPIGGIAQWEGRWENIGGGAGSPIQATILYKGELVAAGQMNTFINIVRYDGLAWRPLGAGLDDGVTSLAVFDGELIAGGNFKKSGAVTLNRTGRWNGSVWRPLGSGMNSTVYALCQYNDRLIAAGSFSLADGIPVNNIARWNGVEWQAMGQGLDGGALCLTTANGELLVGGFFAFAGGKPAPYFARWTDSNVPWIAKEPSSQSAPCGKNVDFSVLAATGYEGVTYQWSRNGTPLADGSTDWHSRVTGSDTPTLSIKHVSNGDAGEYQCEVATPCGGSFSKRATLFVSDACCPSDLNGDRVVDDADFNLFVLSFNSRICADPAMPPGCPADLNADEDVNEFDFGIFVVAYNEMLCTTME